MQPSSKPPPTAVPASLTNADAIRAWAEAADRVGDFDDEGDGARRWLLNPTLFALLGEPRGKRVLDAGCGQGYLSRLLAHRGAQITGVEPAAPWYAAALAHEEAAPLGITYLQADLSTLAATHPQLCGAFEIVIANMVLMDIPDYEAAIHSCAAALVPGGAFICTLLHPCFEEPGAAWLRKRSIETREYLHPHIQPQTFGHFVHRPLSAYINTLLDAGFTLRRMVEPQLGEEGAQALQNDRDCHVPSFVALRLTRD
jgi:2-polyprenyl-3-methyl-5-hydroxy-6-metoxy-1,4-benzoquinol methylase